MTCTSAQWQAWLDGDKVSLLVKAFAHAVLGKLVKREGEVVAGQEVTWSQLESDNVVQLSQYGEPHSFILCQQTSSSNFDRRGRHCEASIESLHISAMTR